MTNKSVIVKKRFSNFHKIMVGFLCNMDVLTVVKGYANIDFVEKRFTKVNKLSKEWRKNT